MKLESVLIVSIELTPQTWNQRKPSVVIEWCFLFNLLPDIIIHNIISMFFIFFFDHSLTHPCPMIFLFSGKQNNIYQGKLVHIMLRNCFPETLPNCDGSCVKAIKGCMMMNASGGRHGKISLTLVGVRLWISNYMDTTSFDLIIYPCPNFNRPLFYI